MVEQYEINGLGKYTVVRQSTRQARPGRGAEMLPVGSVPDSTALDGAVLVNYSVSAFGASAGLVNQARN